jgi:hypothetical protein
MVNVSPVELLKEVSTYRNMVGHAALAFLPRLSIHLIARTPKCPNPKGDGREKIAYTTLHAGAGRHDRGVVALVGLLMREGFEVTCLGLQIPRKWWF